jgi:hypothetical protein
MRATRTIPLLLLIAWITTTGAGCTDLFKPRTPEPPTEAGVPTNYFDPDSTLATMARAIVAKAGSNALSAYLGGLADSVGAGDGAEFYAYFDAAAAARWQSVSGRELPAVWTRIPLEERFFNSLPGLSGTRPFEFDWLPDVEHPIDEELGINQKLLHRQYLLLALPTGVENADTLAIGYADLLFIKSLSADKWVIRRWQDRVDPAVGANPVNPSQLSFSARRLGVY